jgi:hypothetical protein
LRFISFLNGDPAMLAGDAAGVGGDPVAM